MIKGHGSTAGFGWLKVQTTALKFGSSIVELELMSAKYHSTEIDVVKHRFIITLDLRLFPHQIQIKIHVQI